MRYGRSMLGLTSPGLNLVSVTRTLSLSTNAFCVRCAAFFSCAIAGTATAAATKIAGISSPAKAPADLLMVSPSSSSPARDWTGRSILRLRTGLPQALAHQVDVAAQRVQLVGIGERDADAGGPGVELVEVGEQLVSGLRSALHPVLDLPQDAVPAEDARAHPELVERRHPPRQRDQHRDYGEQRHPHAVDQVGERERQVALQEGRPRAVKALGFARDRELAVLRRGKLAGLRDPAGAAVNARRGLDEELD